MDHKWIVVGFNFLGGISVIAALWLLAAFRSSYPKTAVFVLGLALAILACIGAFLGPTDPFGKLQLLAWALFVHVNLFLIGAAYLLLKRNYRPAVVCASLAFGLTSLGIYSFVVEPHRLKTVRVTLTAAKLKIPVRVAMIADIQTEEPGSYEMMALRKVQDEHPDLILFLGDYVQVRGRERYTAACKAFNKMLHEVNLQAPLGIHAVRGNVDRSNIRHWYFSGLPVTIFERTHSVDLGPLILTGLAFEDSLDKAFPIQAQKKFHIVFGHHPNFSLGRIDADLLLAGHTHGGQVVLPFLGPILTISRVPRSWAAGLTSLGPNKTLIVSRGIGMERVNAPQMRFNCNPEVVIVDLAPAR